ncbi:MAG: DNA translocase FtsK 4TM domain-containing protein [Lachnospiraceae bacterium]
MASGQTKKNNTSSNRKNTSAKNKKNTNTPAVSQDIIREVGVILLLVMCVLLFISNFGLGGIIGSVLSDLFFGIFGIYAYVFPCVLFIGVCFFIANRNNGIAVIKITALILAQVAVCGLLHALLGNDDIETFRGIFRDCAQNHTGGGWIGVVVCQVLSSAFGMVGAVIVLLTVLLIAAVIVSERSFLRGVQRSGTKVNEIAREESIRRKERAEEKKVRRENRLEKKVSGVNMDVKLERKTKAKSDMSELKDEIRETREEILLTPEMTEIPVHKEKPKENPKKMTEEELEAEVVDTAESISPSNYRYQFPPLRLLRASREKNTGNSMSELRETAARLQQILKDFGVNVTVTDVSCGPSVTRYELQPDHGVKVSKILALSDDIKLNLAVADIRIEAPIPGKAAVGIEVPNKENTTVTLRELLSSEEFVRHSSNLAFAVGKDIGGKIMIADIAKMPHLLIAGATGSGKSVCINTLIMSLLYKSAPDDVRLIMIDPKVVELSAYNGIPHLLIPVVTDPKKAAGALNWAVAEMTRRYQLFAEYQVRNLEGYNAKVKSIEMIEDDEKPEKLPQIVIIVDELADLMMVAPGDVEDAICRLAQLARAAGIHLIIATQRPSVNVITGLIKANMPSRLAFAVSSGVDSRTILDMNGAEKLLGKGDMLFYPYGYPKPVRIQGAFVSDEEVGAVVEFLKKNNTAMTAREDIEEHIRSKQSAVPENAAAGSSGDGKDPLFADAAKFIIEKDKASIGMLQRWFKIGFNRAARIMDQLAEAGIVGEEQGTKPREILMSPEQLEQYIEENV